MQKFMKDIYSQCKQKEVSLLQVLAGGAMGLLALGGGIAMMSAGMTAAAGSVLGVIAVGALSATVGFSMTCGAVSGVMGHMIGSIQLMSRKSANIVRENTRLPSPRVAANDCSSCKTALTCKSKKEFNGKSCRGVRAKVTAPQLIGIQSKQ